METDAEPHDTWRGAISWGVGQQLVAAVSPHHPTAGAGTGVDGGAWHELRACYIPENRQLLTDGHFLFLHLQQEAAREWSSEERRGALLYEVSRRYRSLMYDQQAQLRVAVSRFLHSDAQQDAVIRAQYDAQLQLWDRALQLWHLFEVCYVLPSMRVALALIGWCASFSSFMQKIRNELERWQTLREPACQQDRYWEFVFTSLLHGQLRIAQDLLLLHRHSADDQHPVADLIRFLGDVPPLEGLARPNFSTRVQKWRQYVLNTSNDWSTKGRYRAEPEMHDIVRLLTGSWYQEAQREDLCKVLPSIKKHNVDVGWKSMLVAAVVYCHPTTTNLNLGVRLRDVFAMRAFGKSLRATPEGSLDMNTLTGARQHSNLPPFRTMEEEDEESDGDGEDQLDVFDTAMMDAIERRPGQALLTCFQAFRKLPMAVWLVAHLSDFLFHCGQLQSAEMDLRRELLVNLAMQLASIKACWQLAADYFAACPQNGHELLKQFVSHIAIDSEKKAFKVINLCQKHGLMEHERVVYSIIARRALQQGRYGASIHWYIMSGEERRVASVAMRFMEEYVRAEVVAENSLTRMASASSEPVDVASHPDLARIFEIDGMVNALTPLHVTTNKLGFLLKYCKLNKLFRNGDYDAAGRLIVEVLIDRIAPKKFWLHILYRKALPLLEYKPRLIFDPEASCALMQALEELSMSHRKEYLNVLNDEDGEKQCQEIRYGITNNLSRSLLSSAPLPYSPIISNVMR